MNTPLVAIDPGGYGLLRHPMAPGKSRQMVQRSNPHGRPALREHSRRGRTRAGSMCSQSARATTRNSRLADGMVRRGS